ncbi:hypothetical protein NLM59_03025 [Weeksellaceae bacterium KMM 9724]|uniref:ATP-grasp domain-containing protein n=1 Tax=Profundicola chukchiensis TaxID=2961959 RepID=UPI0024394BFC|nr:hypothetical protein [Profundicola chukchiensis]MDG4949886.1 hypothetical protein [Profundicola chukchiensis]
MNIIISPIFQNFFSGRIWMGLDFMEIKKELESKYQAKVQVIPLKDIKRSLNDIPEGAVLFYSSVYNPEYLKFIQDSITYISLKRPDIILMPNQHQLNALENKGYQELYKDLIGIEKVHGEYFGDIDDLLSIENSLDYPFVLKKNMGALSSGVQLIKSKNELINFREREKKRSLKERIAFKINKRNSFKKDSNLNPHLDLLEENFQDVFSKRTPVVVQEFIPDLDCDYKILIFGDKYYTFRRETRNNDFRASGSGKFSFIAPPLSVLDYAREINDKFKVPFISIDIGIDKNGECYLFEFQGTAFGPIGVTQSKFHLKYVSNEWIKVEESPNLEKAYAYAIHHFVNSNKKNENP